MNRIKSAKWNQKATSELINNFGRKVNLNNAKKALQKEISNMKNEIRVRYNRGEFMGKYNRQLERLKNMLQNVNRKLRLRGPPIQRHFSLQNFSRIEARTNALKKYGISAWNMYTKEMNKLIKKYHIPQSGNYRRNLAIKMIEANREARNQLARQYGLYWEMKAAEKRFKRRRIN
jgi:hypothetical protein